MSLPCNAAIAAMPLYHARHATHACAHVAELRSARHSQCFRVSPDQRWRRVARAGHGYLLMRPDPQRPGEPLLYFRRSSLAIARDAPSDEALAATTRSAATPQPADAAPLGPFASLATPKPPRAATAHPVHSRNEHLPLVLLLWALIIAGAALLAWLVRRGKRPLSFTSRCVQRLRNAGWEARARSSAGPGDDVVARHNGTVLSLRCHASLLPVDVEAVESACRARDTQRSDVAAIVSDAPVTEAARQLAEQTGVMLLREEELASFET